MAGPTVGEAGSARGPRGRGRLMANMLIISTSSDEAAGADRESLARAAAQRGWRVLLAPPLYHLTSDANLWRQLRSETGPLAVAGDR